MKKIIILFGLLFSIPTYAEHPKLLGKYQFNLEIGNRIFEDIVILKEKKVNHSNLIIGTYEVPGAFTSKIYDFIQHQDQFSLKRADLNMKLCSKVKS